MLLANEKITAADELDIIREIAKMQELDAELRVVGMSVGRLSPDLEELLDRLRAALQLDQLAKSEGLQQLGVRCGAVLDLCLSLVLVALRVGTPGTSPFKVRLAWLQKLPLESFASERLLELLAMWAFPKELLATMDLTPKHAEDAPESENSPRRCFRISRLSEAVTVLVGVLSHFIELQALLQREVSQYCGPLNVNIKQKTKLCCFFLDRKCLRLEDACPYAHSYDEIRRCYQSQTNTSDTPFVAPRKPLPRPPASPSADDAIGSGTSRLHAAYRVPQNAILLREPSSSSSSHVFDRKSWPWDFHTSVLTSSSGNRANSSNQAAARTSTSPTGVLGDSGSTAFSPLAGLAGTTSTLSNESLDFASPGTDLFSTPPTSPPSPGQRPHSSPASTDTLSTLAALRAGPTNNSTSPAAGGKQRRKTQICRHWRRSYCRLGERCNFAHGSEDLAPFVKPIDMISAVESLQQQQQLQSSPFAQPPSPPTRKFVKPSLKNY